MVVEDQIDLTASDEDRNEITSIQIEVEKVDYNTSIIPITGKVVFELFKSYMYKHRASSKLIMEYRSRY